MSGWEPNPRSGVLVLVEPPCADPLPGTCAWCGEPIQFIDHLSEEAFKALAPGERPRFYGQPHHGIFQRTRHRGDCWEVGARNCLREFNQSRTWNSRHAIQWRERQAGRPLACVDCGLIVEGPDPMSGEGQVPWEADHEIPIIDGGPHTLDNLKCRCVPCHSAKTAREATARAERRRCDPKQERLAA